MRITLQGCWSFAMALSLSAPVLADGPSDNIPDKVRQVPPPGATLSEADQQDLNAELAKLNENLAKLKASKDARIQSLIPDVEIYSRAISGGLKHKELFPADKPEAAAKSAKQVLSQGLERSQQLLKGEAPWTRAKGLVVRGYRSKIDKTVQPYGLVIPESYNFDGGSSHRLDFWFHGRFEPVGEMNFIQQRMTSTGNITPKDTIVLHPYARFSNANKLAGEIDCLEALEHAQKWYRVDEDRIAVRGFSMGGAAAWQFAVHYADRWFAANPGAGFAETPEFLRVFQNEIITPSRTEKKLLHYYDCTDWAANLYHLPTVAYSGEIDKQKQAADIMEEALKKEGLKLTHLIGPKTGHSIHPDTKKVIEEKLDAIARLGRDTMPHELHFVTYTLKYNRMHWLTVTGLGEHFEQARVDGQLHSDVNGVELKTKNVTSFTLAMSAGHSPFNLRRPVTVTIDSVAIPTERPETDASWTASFVKVDGKWQQGMPADGLRKKHDLQGPIDDAFMDSFIVVRPTGKAAHEKVDAWTKSELAHLVQQWRQQFRGDAIVKDDTAISDDDIKNSNLIVFGDPSSNAFLKRVVGQLPLQWTASEVGIGEKKFAATEHAPVLIYPNPLNSERYVVLNSGFTYREFAYLNNARQHPKLPDWAIVDLKTPANPVWPGKIVAADFFGEQWQVVPYKAE